MIELDEGRLKQIISQCIDLGKIAREDGRIRMPHVGAMVISADGEILGTGYKRFVGRTHLTIHAERDALNNTAAGLGNVNRLPYGCTLATTLEPCIKLRNNSIFKPCSELIVEMGVSRVVIGRVDTSPFMCGRRGIDYLEEQGIEVILFEDLKEHIERALFPKHLRRCYHNQNP